LSFLESRFVNGGTLALDAFGIVPESEPREVFADSLDIAGRALLWSWSSIRRWTFKSHFAAAAPYVKAQKADGLHGDIPWGLAQIE
jgi:hypothetical protein